MLIVQQPIFKRDSYQKKEIELPERIARMPCRVGVSTLIADELQMLLDGIESESEEMVGYPMRS